jgi:electron transfer flavoprotein beta subunit
MHVTGVVVTEEAIRLKEKKIATEIIAVSIGGKACQESLRTALAMGADRGIHIETNSRTDQEVQPLAVAKTLKFLAEVRTCCFCHYGGGLTTMNMSCLLTSPQKEKADLVIVGKQSIDADSCQTGQMLAGLLNWPQCTFAAKFDVAADKKVPKTEHSLPALLILKTHHLFPSVTTYQHFAVTEREGDPRVRRRQ